MVLPRSVRPGWPLRSKTTTSFSPARSQGPGTYRVFWGPMLQIRPRGCHSARPRLLQRRWYRETCPRAYRRGRWRGRSRRPRTSARKGQLRRFCHRQRIDVPAEQRFAGECDLLRDALAFSAQHNGKVDPAGIFNEYVQLAPAAGTFSRRWFCSKRRSSAPTSLPSRNTCA